MEPVEGLNASIEEQTKFWSAPPPYQAEIDHEGSDIRAIKLVVSITLGITHTIILRITTEELHASAKDVLRYERAAIFDIQRTDEAHIQELYATLGGDVSSSASL